MSILSMLTVHFRCNDSATGKPTPVRMRIGGPDGTTYAPLGRSIDFPTGRGEAVGGHLKLGGERWFYIDGGCEIPLPAGVPLRIQIAKGPEYRPVNETVTLGAGQMALRFAVARILDWRAKHYHTVDTRSHFLPPHAGVLEGQAEDLEVVNVLAKPLALLAHDGNTCTVTPDLLAFSGQSPALATAACSCIVNTLNAHPVLGTVGLLHGHRTVFPLTFGGPDATDDWSLCDWCDQCHRKGGLVVWVDAFEPAGGIVGGEALIAAVLGKIDALEIDSGPRTQPLLPWLYRLWDAGFLVPLVGGSGKESNRTALGSMRTYVHMSAAVGPNDWVEAIRFGRTFAASGILLDYQVNDCHPGAIVNADGPLRIAATAESLTPFDRLEIVAHGAVVAVANAALNRDTSTWSAAIEREFAPAESCWVAARAIGANTFAHTSPIAVRLHGQQFEPRPDAKAMLADLVRKTREWAETFGRYSNVKRREQLLARCDEAIGKL